MADASGLPPPYLDPSQYPSYQDMQRKQMLAQMLMGSLQNSENSPNPSTGVSGPAGAVTPRRGLMQNVAPLVNALLANKAQKSALQSQANYFNPPQPAATAPYDPAASAQAPEGIAAPAPGPGSPTAAPGAPSGLLRPQNPMVPSNMDPRVAQQLMNMLGPSEYAKSIVAPQYQPLDIERQLHAAGIRPGSPEAQAYVAQRLQKENYVAPTPVRTDSALVGPDGNVKFYNPAVPMGSMPQFGSNGQPTSIVPIPGGTAADTAAKAAETAGIVSQTPHYEADPFHPGQSNVSFPRPPAYSGPGPGIAAPAPSGGLAGPPANAATLEGQKAGAAEGIKYASKLTDDANSALQGKRTISEMTNLLQGFTPGAGAPVLAGIGSVAQALGVPPDTVEKYTKMNVGDTQAFQKGTAALASESAKQMTNKVTQQDFKIYLANNPNWMMTPDGIKRAMDYMNRGFDQPIAKQQAFATYSKAASPDRWGIDFDTQWNRSEAERIKNGEYNSAPASLTGVRTSSDQGPTPKYSEGQVAHNPKTGALLVYKGGRWIPQQ